LPRESGLIRNDAVEKGHRLGVVDSVKNTQQESHSASAHQTVTEAIKLKTGKKTITISTTEQKLSAHAGQTSFWGFLHLRKFRRVLAEALPHRRTSPNALKATEIALGFIAGILAGADKLTRIAHLRDDPLLPEVLEIKRMPSQSTLSRFLGGFDGAARNLRSFRALWSYTMRSLPSRRGGYTLDLDSTSLLHEDGRQEGVKVGYTRKGLKPCLKPLLAVLEEAKLVAQFWLRSGNAPCASNVLSFTLELLSNLPRHLRLRLVRADSGFCEDRWLSLLEERNLAYIVVALLHHKITSLLRQETIWKPSAVAGTDVAEVIYRGVRWSRDRRLILIRHRVAEKRRSGGKMLIECPGFTYQALVTSLPSTVAPIEVWRDYNGRAGVENVIKELVHGFGLSKLCCKSFWATEAALSLVVLTYNLSVLFARHLGWLQKVTIGTLRFRLFSTAGILSHAQGGTQIKLGIPIRNRPWWRAIWEKLLSEFPNCNAVAQTP
jgi:hypothetical protein